MPYLSLYARRHKRIPSPLLGDGRFSKFSSAEPDEAKTSEPIPPASPAEETTQADVPVVDEIAPDKSTPVDEKAPLSEKSVIPEDEAIPRNGDLEAKSSERVLDQESFGELLDEKSFGKLLEGKSSIYNQAILTTDHRGVPYIVVVEVPPEEELIKKSWLLNPDKPPKKPNEVYIERVPFEEDMDSLYRSRSLDFSETLKESYLSRWSRENTPIDSKDQYERTVRRSYTPVREYVDDDRKPLSIRRIRTPLDVVTVPLHTNYRYYQEQQPFRKYDIFQIRTWAYPIYKYLHGRDHQATRPYSYTRVYGNASLYTPPKIAAEPVSMTSGRSYSGYVYMAGEHSFDVYSRPRSLDNYNFWRSHVTRSPWYWTYYGNSGLRHYNSFRPRAYTSRLSTYWSPYY